jgi:hypothetical protein
MAEGKKTEETEEERRILGVLCEHAIDQLEEVIEQWANEDSMYGKYVLRRELDVLYVLKARFYTLVEVKDE